MVVSGKARGDANQLADYLLAQGENERVTILDVDGGTLADEQQLRDLLYSMELNSELTRSRKSVYHGFINPNPNEKEDRMMTAEEWQRSADIMAKHLNLEQQRRVIVLHEKAGRIHAHVVFERYDHERGIMVDYKHNYKAHDIARAEMEVEFGHKRTPNKNPNRENHKKKLSDIWQQTKNGREFIREAEKQGYKIAKGKERPFMVIDENGRSFDLVRKLENVKTKEVKERLSEIDLVDEKTAIRQKRQQKEYKENTKLTEEYKPLNQKDMLFEVFEEQKTEKELFNSLSKKHREEMANRHHQISKEYGSFDKIPSDVLQRMKAEYNNWKDQWGHEGEQATKLTQDHYRSIDDILDDMYKDDLRSIFAINENDMVEKGYDRKEKFSDSIKDLSQTDYAKQREAFKEEIRQAEQNKRDKGIEFS